MKESVLKIKSDLFGDRIVKMHIYLNKEKKEFVLSKQILRSGTSIGANVAEASYAASKKDFLSKITIAAKECAETVYWLNKLKTGNFLKENEFNSMHQDCLEIVRLLNANIKTLKQNLNT